MGTQPYKMGTQPLKALIIGAGFAGIAAAIKLREAGIDDFIIAEKTGGLSGTWYDNVYPGAACDVPSHLYSYSFAPNPNWSRRFSPSGEIREYVEDVVNRTDLEKHIRPNTEILSAKFNVATALWHAKTKATETKKSEIIIARFLIASVAILGTPKLPDIDGMKDFKGAQFHSARWDKNVNIKGKSVAVIGSAASTIQIAPALAKIGAKISIFQRTPNWIIPRMDRAYSGIEKSIFARLPFTMKLTRLAIYLYLDFMFYRVFKSRGWINKYLTSTANRLRTRKIKDPELRRKLTPDYPIGCKRVLLSDDYYDTINMDNVELITDGINRITKDGVMLTNGREVEADIIAYATGFQATEFLPHLELTGVGGAKLANWRQNPKAHKGLVIPDMPNAFFLLGPNTGLGHASMILMIEAQTPYMLALIQAVPDGKYFKVKPDVVRAYNAKIQSRLKTSIWATSCQSWYKTEDGSIPTLWPYPVYTYKKMMRRLDMAEFDICS
jgi:cation diffusion facilitator CzcD-associated flavoprotein CzcO